MAEIGYAEQEEEQLKTRIARFERSLDEATTDVTTLEARKEAHEKELKTKMTKGLTSEEGEQVESLSRQVGELQKTLSDKAKERGEVNLGPHLSVRPKASTDSPISFLLPRFADRDQEEQPRDRAQGEFAQATKRSSIPTRLARRRRRYPVHAS